MQRIQFRPLLAAIAVSLVLSGCDTIDPGTEEIVVTHEQEFRFEATRAQLEDGEVITAGDNLNILPTLEEVGFGRGDIVGAEVVGAEISRTTPVGVDLDQILSSASLRLRTGGAELQVAQVMNIGSGSSTPMQTSAADVGAIARASSVSLLLVPEAVDDLADDGNYVFRVRLRLRIDLEGI